MVERELAQPSQNEGVFRSAPDGSGFSSAINIPRISKTTQHPKHSLQTTDADHCEIGCEILR